MIFIHLPFSIRGCFKELRFHSGIAVHGDGNVAGRPPELNWLRDGLPKVSNSAFDCFQRLAKREEVEIVDGERFTSLTIEHANLHNSS
jgi:hypothetical protein